jgi:hypothetical protein
VLRTHSIPNKQTNQKQKKPAVKFTSLGGIQKNVPPRVRYAPSPQNQLLDRSQLGSVVRTKLSRLGLGDIKRLVMSWVAGYTYVGDGTNGTAASVYFLPASAGTPKWLVRGFVAGSSSGQVPIAGSDPDLGQAYIADVEKHFQRKIIRAMRLRLDSLQPSTSNNMMVVVAPSRGPGGTAASVPITYATAAVTANTVENVSSMKGSFPVDSWESKVCDITEFIAGGSGAKQNEFEISKGPAVGTSIYVTSGVYPVDAGVGCIPGCFAIAGNCTTAGLNGTKVHLVSIEQEVDLIDFVGGMSQAAPIS